MALLVYDPQATQLTRIPNPSTPPDLATRSDKCQVQRSHCTHRRHPVIDALIGGTSWSIHAAMLIPSTCEAQLAGEL